MTAPIPVVTVTLYRGKPGRFRRRPQTWRWVAKSANGRVLATGGEAYTNRADAVDAIWTLFGPAAMVKLHNDDGSYYLLRSAVDGWS